jgi:hypothetical protein
MGIVLVDRLGRERLRLTGRYDDCDLSVNQFAGQRRQPIGSALGPAESPRRDRLRGWACRLEVRRETGKE